jgi:hypothetical protein
VDTKLFLKCRQLSASLWATVLLVKHVSWFPTQQTNFHLNMYWLFLTTMQSQFWLVESRIPLGFLILQGKRVITDYHHWVTHKQMYF